ncbi:LuxR C-terminal-related transcriptional regulator [Nocardia sp. NPDC020380]|uniref:LuxR C-terminal-related transcriptional regulator n=1 Tax=Nocardia sp. NPDC020380 TaxID=3364309 RepID=UPI0037AA7723
MAVLGGTATTGRVAALLDVPVAEIRTAMADLAESGLIDAVGRASQVVTGRVLGEMSEAEYRGLHGRAAELLHHGGFPAGVVATHLLEAGGARGSWAARVLVAAADDALAGDELERAGRCLDLAYRAARRADERAAIATRLVSVEWRINPSSRTRNFGRLKAALRTGRVPQADLPGTVLHMLWHGYGLHADHALARLDRAAGISARGAGTSAHGGAATGSMGGADGAAPGVNGADGAAAGANDPLSGANGADGSARAADGSIPDPGGAGRAADRSVRAGEIAAGSPGRAAEAVARVAGSPARADDAAGHAARLGFLVSWLRYTHPGHVQRHPSLVAAADLTSEEAVGQQESPHSQAGLLLAALCAPAVDGGSSAVSVQDSACPPATEMAGVQRVSGGSYASRGIGGDLDEIAAGAQRLLARQRLTLTTVEPLVAAVDCLMYCDRLDTADAWCASLLAEATARNAPAWQSIFAAARAEALLRKGDLVGAAEHAVLALNVLPAEQLGVWVGRPIAVLVLALTGQGKHAEAAAQLERPIPRAMFESRFALLYLTAHGRHCLATGRVEEALGHFRRCGRLMQEWGLDFAWLVPWRNELAAASLWAGRHWQAQTFATRHLDLIGRAEHHQTGAVSLRLLAATSEPHRRVPLLRRAVTIARSGVDRIELALVLADLGTAYRAIGDMDRARPLLREATRLANASDSAAVRKRLPANGAQHRPGLYPAAGQGPVMGARPAITSDQAGITAGRPDMPVNAARTVAGRSAAAAGWPESAGGQENPSGGRADSAATIDGRPGVPDRGRPAAVPGRPERPGGQVSSTGSRFTRADGRATPAERLPGAPNSPAGTATGGTQPKTPDGQSGTADEWLPRTHDGRSGGPGGWLPEVPDGREDLTDGWLPGDADGQPDATGDRLPGTPDGRAGTTGDWLPGASDGRAGTMDEWLPGTSRDQAGATSGRLPGIPDGRTGAPDGRAAGAGGRSGNAVGGFGGSPGSGFGSAPGDLPVALPGKFSTGSLAVRPPAPTGDPLSPAERRVAELAAQGNRNRDIAEALDITTSTVEQHLTRVYRKLAVSRRSELRFALLARSEGTTHTAVG